MRAPPIAIGLSCFAWACAPPAAAIQPDPVPTGSATVAAVAARPPCDASTPVEAARQWVDAMERGNWLDVIDCLPPHDRERARQELSSTPEETQAHQMSVVQRTAARVREALRGQPSFVNVEPTLAEPAQLEWYYCGERPAGAMWQSPCAVSVVEVGGRFYVWRVTGDER